MATPGYSDTDERTVTYASTVIGRISVIYYIATSSKPRTVAMPPACLSALSLHTINLSRTVTVRYATPKQTRLNPITRSSLSPVLEAAMNSDTRRLGSQDVPKEVASVVSLKRLRVTSLLLDYSLMNFVLS